MVPCSLHSKVTPKGQITFPPQGRARLELRAGDQLVYAPTASGILIRKVRPFDAAWQAGLEKSVEVEWNSPEDEEDFGDL